MLTTINGVYNILQSSSTKSPHKDSEADKEAEETEKVKKEPLSLEEMVTRKRAEEEEQSRPKFLTKEQRAEEALKKRQQQVRMILQSKGDDLFVLLNRVFRCAS